MRLSVIVSFLVFSSIEHAYSQNAYVKLGQQAYIDGNFKAAIMQLEKGCLIDSTNANALWMLGYSYYHSDNYVKSIATFTKEIAITPADASAYYYRARAKCHLGKDSPLPADKEKYLLGAIVDLTKAIAINPNDAKINSFYQNRGIAYRDYGIFKLQASNNRFYDKQRAISSLKASIADLQKVLDGDPGRSDISSLIDLSKEKLATAVGHH
jgi:tetratricopeptide (TPR) repeat protein